MSRSKNNVMTVQQYLDSTFCKNPKDPKRQLQGRINRENGEVFEGRLDRACDYYREKGIADIIKTPEPMKVIKSLGKGQFVACFTKKAQADYMGVGGGGVPVVMEAKYCTKDRIEQSRVSEEQAEFLERRWLLGARCGVVVGFSSGSVYYIPWEIFSQMKMNFGRKYALESDLELFEVDILGGIPLFLD